MHTPPGHSWGQGSCRTLWITSGFLMRLPHSLCAHCFLSTLSPCSWALAATPCLFRKLQLSCFPALQFPHSVCEQQPNLVQHLCHGPLLFLKRGPHPNSCPPLSSQAFFLGGGQESNPKHHACYTSFLLLSYTWDPRLSSQPPSCFFSVAFSILCAPHVCMWAHVMPRVEVREQLAGVGPLFLPRGAQGLTSHHRAWWQVPCSLSPFASPAFITLYIQVNPQSYFFPIHKCPPNLSFSFPSQPPFPSFPFPSRPITPSLP